jgi:uncharacterized protein YcaQ
MVLTKQQARRLALHHQGLGKPDQFGRGIKATQRAIEALRYVQIDTISVVNRAHHHVLQSRVSNYQEAWLNKLLQERVIFEYWHHAAAYLPMEDYRFYLPMMKGYRKHKMNNRGLANKVLKRIEAEGPLQSKDFEAPPGSKSGGWWEWKPAKVALEQLFLSGELMVSERRGFQKVFDLTERVLPGHIDITKPNDRERGHFFVDQMLRAQGVARPFDIGYMRHVPSRWEKYKIMPAIHQALEEQLRTGEVVSIDLDGETFYAKQAHVDELPKRLGNKRLQILSPFDNIIINRDKLQRLFDFQYQVECYVPKPKRQYGYFTLPMLLGDQFIGRIDCKAHRDKARFTVNNIWLEPGTRVDESLAEVIVTGVSEFASCHGAATIELADCSDKHLKTQLKPALQRVGPST